MTTRSASDPGRSSHARRPILWMFAALGVALVATVAIAATRDDGEGAAGDRRDDVVVAEVQAVTIDGDPLAPLPDTGVDSEIASAAPQATGSSFDGSAVELLGDGTPTLVAFFAHWCPHCQREVAELSEHFAESGLPDGVRVVAVSTSVRPDEDNYPPSSWFSDSDWPTEVLVDDADSSLASAYGLSAFPFWAAVDADGELVGRLSGGIGAAQFDALVEGLRAGGQA